MTSLLSARIELRARLRPSLEAVDDFVRLFRLRFRDLLEHDWFETELLLREALNNAVLHGTPPGAEFPIRCILRLKNRSITLVVCDRGAGFPWRAVLSRKVSETSSNGRGLRIYSDFADHVRFNDSGSQVMLLKRISKEKEL